MTPDIRAIHPATDGPLTDSLLSMGRFLRRGEVSADLRAVFLEGGREGDVFYRDRWSHDKVVRSTHGVNCTGSCSWKVYVKDGIITWETQQTDYPSVGPDSPEYEPRGCAPSVVLAAAAVMRLAMPAKMNPWNGRTASQ